MKRIISLLLTALMIFTSVPTAVFAAAEAEQCTVTVETVNSAPGMTVDVSVIIENNPGILGMTMSLEYDESALTLVEGTNGEAFEALKMTPPKKYKSGCNFVWYADDIDKADIADGSILDLSFTVSKEAVFGEEFEINITCQSGSVFDADLDPVDVITLDGSINIMYVPGDVSGDDKVAANDLIMLSRYISDGNMNNNADGYNVNINELAADVDESNSIAVNDLILISRYISDGCITDPDGYNVELKPSPIGLHKHTMEYVAAVEATCTEAGNTEYWYCTGCKKCYEDENGKTKIALEDTVIEKLGHTPGAAATCTEAQICTVCEEELEKAKGHTEVTVSGYAPTYEEEGLSDGIQCSVCKHWIVKQTVLDPLEPDEVSITYKYDTVAGDTYLPIAIAKALTDGKIITQETKDVTTADYSDLTFIVNETIPGYEFQGWYDSTASDARKITYIPKGTSGNITLFAKWKKTEYTVTLKAPLKALDGITRTIDQTTLLPSDKDMVVPNYYFMGWSDGTGKIIDQINPGVENITVYANWTSATRNIAYANDYKNKAPIIFEPSEGDPQYTFVYNVGYIDRVPVAVIKDPIYNSGTYMETIESFETATISEGREKEINSTIANATTHSSSWTLSEEWNELITEVNGKEQSMEEGKVVAISDGSSKAYSSSASTYSGNSFHSSNDSFVSAKTITDDSYKNSASLEAGLSYGPAKVSAKISGEQAHSEHQEDYSESKASLEVSADWNETRGYSVSGESFKNTSKTESILDKAKNTWGIEISKALKDEKARSDIETSSTSSTDGYKSIVAFHNEMTKGNSTTVERTFTEVGYYRYVMFAKVHVFAVVSYDMKTGSYFVNTYSVVDDTMKYDFDYSSDGSFKDYENAVLPFEIPVFVYDYIFANNAKTQGVGIGRDGIVKEYTGDATSVLIPDYATFDNGDGTYEITPVVGVEEGLFEGKNNITSVKLGKFITSIPNNTFKDCTSLKTVEYNDDILDSIGSYAFAGCTALNDLEIGNSDICKVTGIGSKAFENVPSVKIYAANADMVDKAASCGAKSVSVYMKHLNVSEADKLIGKTLKAAETTTTLFALYGGGKEYSGLSVESNAETSIINGITFTDNAKTPLILASSTVNLNRVKINNAPGIAIQLNSESTKLLVESINDISTSGNIAILSKALSISRNSGGEYPELKVTGGDIVVCGEIEALKNFSYLTINDGVIRSVSKTEYDNLLKTYYVYFNANNGSVSTASKEVTYNNTYGTLPTATRDYYKFLGWYTAANGGTKVTDSTKFTATSNVTLYAHWEQNPVSDWVLESAVPSDAQRIESKYMYTLTTAASSSSPEMKGYTQTSSEWVKSSSGTHKYVELPKTFDNSNSLYTKYNLAPLSVYNNGSEKLEITGTTVVSYIFWHWAYKEGVADDNNRPVSDYEEYDSSKNRNYNIFEAGETTTDNSTFLKESANGYDLCELNGSAVIGKKAWSRNWYRHKVYQQSWNKYNMKYYFEKTEQKESNSYPTASNSSETVSNIQKYVKYRAK